MRPIQSAGLAICLLLVAGCGRRETAVEEGVRTHTLLIGNSAEPGSVDPHVLNTLAEQRIQLALFEGLTAYDETAAHGVPAAAERWETSPDGLTWTFHLRDGLVWSNGEPLTADDFVQSWRRALNPAVGCPWAYLFSMVKNADAFSSGKLRDASALGFAAPDPRTVVITLTRPTSILPLYTALPCWHPINPRVLDRFGNLSQRGTEWTRPGSFVGNGPFVLSEWTPNARLVATRNPRYWDNARNQLERIIFRPIENSEVEERDFRAGQLHVTYNVPPAKIAGYQQRTPVRVRIDPILDHRYLTFNVQRPPLDNAKVRRALALAIDRPAITKAVFFGAYQPGPSFVVAGSGDYVSPPGHGFEPETARQLLAEAGYAGGRGLPPLSLMLTTGDTTQRVAEAIQAQWKKELGVEATLEPMELKTKMQNFYAKNYAVGLAGWSADFADPITYLAILASDSGNNFPGWKNARYDALLERALAAPDAATRMALLQQAEALILAESPVTPLIFTSNAYLIQPAVKNWNPTPLNLPRFQFVRLEQ